MKVTVVGTGYVGLVTGACLAEVGNDVRCIDQDADKIDRLCRGETPIHEPGLEPLIRQNSAAKRLGFSTDTAAGVRHGQIIFIAVGTPPDEDGSADLSHILAVARDIGRAIEEARVIVVKSTVPVGTTDRVHAEIQRILDQRGRKVDFSVASNPEFLKEGAAVEDFMRPDRIVIGSDDDRAAEMLRTLYGPFNRNRERVIAMTVRSAELTKYAANAMLATKISFMNEMANLSERLGADIEEVRRGIGADPRIGFEFIYPGCGFGGSCFPKDVRALYQTARQHQYETRILKAVLEVNDDQKSVLLRKATAHFRGSLQGRKFALWGLSFKPDTDDMREAPSRALMEGLWQCGASVAAFDPVAVNEARRIYADREDLELESRDPYAVLSGADGLFIVTEWKLFRSIDLGAVRSRLSGDVVFDGRNVFDPVSVARAGLTYYGIGRPARA